jgi:hypothetical protein
VAEIHMSYDMVEICDDSVSVEDLSRIAVKLWNVIHAEPDPPAGAQIHDLRKYRGDAS